MFMKFINKGQGAVEYLLLLAAAIVVVSIVITFLITTVAPAQSTGSEQTYSYLCVTVEQSKATTKDCGCYLGKNNPFDGVDALTKSTAGKTYCCDSARDVLLRQDWNKAQDLPAEAAYRCP